MNPKTKFVYQLLYMKIQHYRVRSKNSGTAAIAEEETLSIKFCQHLGETPMETLEMLSNVHGESTIARSMSYEWHRRFKEGR
ncbi:hypothetical protein TNCV_68541 [Trichonephila clavipes]|nr:hypothetical protein TNCV_68541 [Trichonephila clavipes]